jgi:hypothetical protein
VYVLVNAGLARGWFGPQWEERKIREYLDRR